MNSLVLFCLLNAGNAAGMFWGGGRRFILNTCMTHRNALSVLQVKKLEY